MSPNPRNLFAIICYSNHLKTKQSNVSSFSDVSDESLLLMWKLIGAIKISYIIEWEWHHSTTYLLERRKCYKFNENKYIYFLVCAYGKFRKISIASMEKKNVVKAFNYFRFIIKVHIEIKTVIKLFFGQAQPENWTFFRK